MIYKKHNCCRVCKSYNLVPYLDLGNMPLSNNLLPAGRLWNSAPSYPLEVLFCEDCSLSQLSIVVPPEQMFTNYVYRSSISKDFRDHCRKWAEETTLSPGALHVDIAGNDGALLEQFKAVHNHQVINVDPAKNLTAICEAKGITVVPEFWSSQVASAFEDSVDLITATNVFAHCDDVYDFLSACKIALKRNGRLILEFPYLIDFIENVEFDTIYHEHLSYFSISPLLKLCRRVGLSLLSVEAQAIHGGSVRVTIGEYGLPDPSVNAFVNREMTGGFYWIGTYLKWAERVRETIKQFEEGIRNILRTETRFIAGFAASAKGNTLLNSAGFTYNHIRFIVDETPEKQGLFTPGGGIPVVPMDHLIRSQPPYLVILSWNFADSIMEKCRAAGYQGKFILPLTFKIIE